MKTLFVPTDLSNHANAALLYALELSKITSVEKLILFHNNPQVINSEIPVLYWDDLKKINEEIKEHLAKKLKKAMDDAAIDESALETEIVVISEAGAVSAIVEHSKKKKADLIIMGTHGKTGMEKLIFGSVTAGVLESESVPVLAIPQHIHFQPINKVAFSSSLTYFTPEIKSILSLIKDLDARLEVIHLDDGLLSEKLISHAQRVLKEIDNQNIELEIIPFNIEEKLVTQIKKHIAKTKPDWLVMIPKKREWYEKLFLSSKTLEVASEYNKPMLVMHIPRN
jgi:nucleotide-binding universal stress UspA family protein